jgi:hypothetical protein
LFKGTKGFYIYNGRLNLNPDYTLPDCGQTLKKVFQYLNTGVPELLIRSKPEPTPVALHYSLPSIHTDWILGYDALRNDAVSGYKAALNELGWNYDYLAYAQLEDDRLDLNRYRILILPMSTALSDREVEAVNKFTANGGIVIADLLPAGFNQHGQRRTSPALDKLFGVTHSAGEIRQEEAMLTGIGGTPEFTLAGLEIKINYFEPALLTAGARALGEITAGGKKYPAVFVNNFGKGYAVYCGCDFLAVFGSWRNMKYLPARKNAARLITAFMAAILQKAGSGTRPVPLKEDGLPLAATNMHFLRNGPARLIGLIRDVAAAKNIDNSLQKITLSLGNKYYLYDVLERKPLGFQDAVACEVGPESHKIFCLLPYRLEAVNIRTDRREYAQGEWVEVDVQLTGDTAEFSPHVLNFHIFGPDLIDLEAYHHIITVEGGKGRFRFPLALNSPVGNWRIEAVEVMTGTTGSAPFQVVRRQDAHEQP